MNENATFFVSRANRDRLSVWEYASGIASKIGPRLAKASIKDGSKPGALGLPSQAFPRRIFGGLVFIAEKFRPSYYILSPVTEQLTDREILAISLHMCRRLFPVLQNYF